MRFLLAKCAVLCYNHKAIEFGLVVKRLRRSPLKAQSRVRFPARSPNRFPARSPNKLKANPFPLGDGFAFIIKRKYFYIAIEI